MAHLSEVASVPLSGFRADPTNFDLSVTYAGELEACVALVSACRATRLEYELSLRSGVDEQAELRVGATASSGGLSVAHVLSDLSSIHEQALKLNLVVDPE